MPNIEVIPYFKDWDVVPWHMLEGDHKNSSRARVSVNCSRVISRMWKFFLMASIRSRTRDEIPLHIHLWAIADV